MYIEKAAKTMFVWKTRAYKVDEINGRCETLPLLI